MAHIRLSNVCVDYPIYNVEGRSLKKQFLHLTTGGRLRSENSKCIVRSLDNLTLNIEHGDRVGLLGHNGAGKSTLLRVLANIYEPTTGSIDSLGRVSSLFNVTLGFDSDATGYENITIRSILQGMSKSEIQQKIQEIADFTELGDYLNMPIRTYSSGMQLRLAFAVATAVHPEILLIDEVVGAGDANFMAKAKIRMNNLIDRASIVVLAVHDTEMLKQFCNKLVLLDAGKLVFYGDINEGLDFYKKRINASE